MLGQSKNAFQAEIDAACELIDFLRFNVSYLEEIYKQEPKLKGLVLDLRNDPGGLLDAAVAVSAVFLPENINVVSTNGQLAESKFVYKASPEFYRRSSGSDRDRPRPPPGPAGPPAPPSAPGVVGRAGVGPPVRCVRVGPSPGPASSSVVTRPLPASR